MKPLFLKDLIVIYEKLLVEMISITMNGRHIKGHDKCFSLSFLENWFQNQKVCYPSLPLSLTRDMEDDRWGEGVQELRNLGRFFFRFVEPSDNGTFRRLKGKYLWEVVTKTSNLD